MSRNHDLYSIIFFLNKSIYYICFGGNCCFMSGQRFIYSFIVIIFFDYKTISLMCVIYQRRVMPKPKVLQKISPIGQKRGERT